MDMKRGDGHHLDRHGGSGCRGRCHSPCPLPGDITNRRYPRRDSWPVATQTARASTRQLELLGGCVRFGRLAGTRYAGLAVTARGIASLWGAMRPGKATLAPSSSGLGRRPLKAVAPVQIRSGLLTK